MNIRPDNFPNVNEIPRLLELQKKMGFEFIQSNGQRIFGPPLECRGPPPPKGSEVFVGKLPRDCFEDELVPFMEKAGNIHGTRLMMDFSGTNRGYAFVMYRNPQDAARAVRELNNTEIRVGRTVGVVKSIDNCRLFIGGVPKNKSKEEIFEALSKLVDGIKSIILYNSLHDKTKNRGFAFIEFDSHRSAAMARRMLLYCKPKLWGYEVAVDWAEPELDVDETVMSKVTALYVRNLMLSTPEERILEVFSAAGGCLVERVKKIRDFAFVHFTDRKSAEKALQNMNGQVLDGANLEVTWAKPVNKHAYLMHKAMFRPNLIVKESPRVQQNLIHHSDIFSWPGTYGSRPTNSGINRRPGRGDPEYFRSQNHAVGNMSLAEVNSKEGCCLIDPTGMAISKEKADCCEEVSPNMIYYKQVAVAAFPIGANGADSAGYHVVQTNGRNGYDQSLITSGTIPYANPLMLPPPTVLPDAAYAMAAPAFFMHPQQNIPGSSRFKGTHRKKKHKITNSVAISDISNDEWQWMTSSLRQKYFIDIP